MPRLSYHRDRPVVGADDKNLMQSKKSILRECGPLVSDSRDRKDGASIMQGFPIEQKIQVLAYTMQTDEETRESIMKMDLFSI